MKRKKQTRRLSTCEFKLSLVEWYYKKDNNILQTVNKFKVDRKQIRNWTAGNKILESRKAQYPLLEQELSQQFCEQRNLGKSIKNGNLYQKQRMLENISLCLIVNIQIVGLLGLVGETNYHFVKRLMLLRRFRKNLNLQSRNLM